MLRTLRAKTLIDKIFLLKENVEMTMQTLQEKSQSIDFLCFRK